jgi:hypothetical protein
MKPVQKNVRSVTKKLSALIGVFLMMILISCGGKEENTQEADVQSNSPNAVVTVGDEQYEYELRCAPDSGDDGALIVSGRVGYGGDREVLGGFGYQERVDRLTVDEAGTRWMAEAGDGSEQTGEISSVTLDVEAGTVSGEAIFENIEGETVSGSFEFRCP